MSKYYIEIIKYGPPADPDRKKTIQFDSAIEARKAYQAAQAFWLRSDKTAIRIEGKNTIITVSTNAVSEVSLYIEEKLKAARKR